MSPSSSKKQHALPYPFYFLPALFLAISGIAATIYLAYAHYNNYTDISYASFCAITKAINCDTVSQSPWSIIFGLPVALWGLHGYVLFGMILYAVHRKDDKIVLWSVLLLLSFVFSLIAVFLGYISSAKIHSYCIVCIFTYFVSFSLFLYSFIIWRRFGSCPYLQALKSSGVIIIRSTVLKFGIVAIFASMLVLPFAIPQYWTLVDEDLSGIALPHGITEEGHPWIGAEEPEIVIEEYSDYQCFQCYKLHFALRSLVKGAPDRIRLIHRHYPLDHEFNPVIAADPFHIGSGRLALLAIAAGKQGKFWETNDLLYKSIRNRQNAFDFEEIAQQLNIDLAALQNDFVSPASQKLLRSDIIEGLQHNITGTPAFVVQGEVYQGTLPAFLLANP